MISSAGVPLLADFGLSHMLVSLASINFSASSSFKGTVRWMAPELMVQDNRPTIQSDIWAFGMIIYVCELDFVHLWLFTIFDRSSLVEDNLTIIWIMILK